MNNFAALYRYEIKKALGRRATIIIFLVIFALVIATNITEFIVASRAAECNDSALVGRALDDSLFDEMREGVIPNIMTDSLGNQEIENVTYENEAYRHLFQYLLNCAGNCTRAYNMSEAQLKKTFNEILDYAYDDFKLTDSEIAYWNVKRSEEQIPPLYDRTGGWGNSLVNLYMANFFILVAIGGSLSGIFADEYSSRTAPIVAASSKGKEKLSLVKILAGCTLGLLEATIIIAGNSATQFILYGGVDSNASVQLVYGPSLLDMTAKKAFLASLGIMIVISLFYSVFAMLLSQLFRNTTVPIAVMAVLLICSMLNPPSEYRVISQIASYFPATFPGSWTFTDYRLLNLFGLKLNILQVLPILYAALSAIFVILIYRNYRKTNIR